MPQTALRDQEHTAQHSTTPGVGVAVGIGVPPPPPLPRRLGTDRAVATRKGIMSVIQSGRHLGLQGRSTPQMLAAAAVADRLRASAGRQWSASMARTDHDRLHSTAFVQEQVVTANPG